MSSFFRRHLHHNSNNDADSSLDLDQDEVIDPELRLRTVRTAASAIAESIRSERRAERRRKHKKASKFLSFSRKPDKEKYKATESAQELVKVQPAGARRNIYVNCPLSLDELDSRGEPRARYFRNKVRTSSE